MTSRPMRILTLNAGLLDFFLKRLVPSPFVVERLNALPEALRQLNADVVALQEVYSLRHKESIATALKEIYPSCLYARENRGFGLPNGLMVLTKPECICRFERFRVGPCDERLFDNKGFLVCGMKMETESESVCLVNVHTTAGGSRIHPESRIADEFRVQQIEQMLQAIKGEARTTIIVGDLNCGPVVSKSNFDHLLRAGFVSVFDLLHAGKEGFTWEPDNSLNANGPHRTSPAQRVDHVLVRQSDVGTMKVIPVSCEVCLREPIIFMRGRAVTVSDHYGVIADLRILLKKEVGPQHLSVVH